MARIVTLLLFLAALPLGACQTISHGTTQMVEVRSEPTGATVTVPGHGTRTTPTYLLLPRNQSHSVTLSKEGFKTMNVTITAQLAPSRATPEPGVLSVLGSAIDAASGGSWELKPDKLIVSMEPSVMPAGAAVAKSAKSPSPPLTTVPAGAHEPLQADARSVLMEQIARIDSLLEQGVITPREHEILKAAAVGAAALAGVPPTQ